ncbi:pyridoxamine 5'-phosphate oxidase family protein [Pseudarthrobacter sp.]|uniref:pyridoxamine 5'-phosphate oxidase family protein n=1 Tax=Pseudarthrobacter sp. TaxID=1934409 RepID=UPI003FA7E2BB
MINGAVPEILPVNFVTVGETVVIRTAPGTRLRALLSGVVVAFETDGLNAYATDVWSVVSRKCLGRCRGPSQSPESRS